jgi:hypothetical protein
VECGVIERRSVQRVDPNTFPVPLYWVRPQKSLSAAAGIIAVDLHYAPIPAVRLSPMLRHEHRTHDQLTVGCGRPIPAVNGKNPAAAVKMIRGCRRPSRDNLPQFAIAQRCMTVRCGAVRAAGPSNLGGRS